MRRRLKIVMVVDIFHGFCGGGMVSTERIVSLLRENHEVIVISTDPEGNGNISVPPFYPPLPGIHKYMDNIGFVFAVPNSKKLYEVISTCDIVHVQLPFLLSQKAVSTARKLGKPVISSFHVQAENILYSFNLSNRMILKILYWFFISTVYNRTDTVVCPSEFARSELIKYGLSVPTVVISNGITEKYRPDPLITRTQDVFTICNVGRFAPEKRQDIIIEAVKRSCYADNIQLILSGRGALEQKLLKAAETLPRKAKIGFFSEEELVNTCNSANLYVHASEVELESLTILEAMGCGLTALISDCPTSAASQFAHNERFLFHAGNPSDLAGKIDYWYEHREELSQWHQITLEKADQYRISQTIEQLEKVYAECTAHSVPVKVDLQFNSFV